MFQYRNTFGAKKRYKCCIFKNKQGLIFSNYFVGWRVGCHFKTDNKPRARKSLCVREKVMFVYLFSAAVDLEMKCLVLYSSSANADLMDSE